MSQPQVIVFDVNETLSDMSPMAARFADVGAPEHLAKLWFATLLRDGFALAATGTQEEFSVLGETVLRSFLAGVSLDRDMDSAAEHVMAGFMSLPLHPDVREGVEKLHAAGLRLVTLTNGSSKVAEELFAGAGIGDLFERLLSVEDAGIWKPARRSYGYAARTCDAELGDMLLVAVHPWDIDGAARAGMSTAWINRDGVEYPPYFTAPQYTLARLTDLPARLGL